MACFLLPLALGTIIVVLKKIAKQAAERLKLDILAVMMLGGALVLMLEHMWHGEVVPWPPFLTAMQNPEDFATAMSELMTTGTTMSIVVTGTWASILLITRTRLQKINYMETVKPVVHTSE